MIVRWLADGTLIVILLASFGALAYFIKGAGWWQPLGRIIPPVIMAGLTSLLVAKSASLLYQPSVARPFIERGVEAGAAYVDNPGFPSDHALLAAVAVMIVYMVTPYKKLSYLLAFLVIAMSIARVIALVHTPLDVICGVIFGLIGIIWLLPLRHKHKA